MKCTLMECNDWKNGQNSFVKKGVHFLRYATQTRYISYNAIMFANAFQYNAMNRKMPKMTLLRRACIF